MRKSGKAGKIILERVASWAIHYMGLKAHARCGNGARAALSKREEDDSGDIENGKQCNWGTH